MSVNWVKGDLLEADVDYICHQVNCQGKMGSGIAKSIKDKWPVVYNEYIKFFEDTRNRLISYHTLKIPPIDVSHHVLGQIQKIEVDPHNAKYVINMFAQEWYGYDRARYTSYDAFWECLHHIKEQVPKGSSIGFPKGIGCGLGGANWKIIETMIVEVLEKDFKVYIYELEK